MPRPAPWSDARLPAEQRQPAESKHHPVCPSFGGKIEWTWQQHHRHGAPCVSCGHATAQEHPGGVAGDPVSDRAGKTRGGGFIADHGIRGACGDVEQRRHCIRRVAQRTPDRAEIGQAVHVDAHEFVKPQLLGKGAGEDCRELELREDDPEPDLCHLSPQGSFDSIEKS